MKCDRCNKETDSTIMSFFNTQRICVPCEDAEKQHPRYEEARAAESAACLQGDYNFPGIGWTDPKEALS